MFFGRVCVCLFRFIVFNVLLLLFFCVFLQIPFSDIKKISKQKNILIISWVFRVCFIFVFVLLFFVCYCYVFF